MRSHYTPKRGLIFLSHLNCSYFTGLRLVIYSKVLAVKILDVLYVSKLSFLTCYSSDCLYLLFADFPMSVFASYLAAQANRYLYFSWMSNLRMCDLSMERLLPHLSFKGYQPHLTLPHFMSESPMNATWLAWAMRQTCALQSSYAASKTDLGSQGCYLAPSRWISCAKEGSRAL